MDSIFLDTFHGLVELLTSMMEFNKYVLDPSFVSYIKVRFKGFCLSPWSNSKKQC
jgi:hypothetical protein